MLTKFYKISMNDNNTYLVYLKPGILNYLCLPGPINQDGPSQSC